MKFTKMQGIGNDYIYVNCFEERIDNKSEASIRLSDRHFGIGSDGLICINPSETADFEMEMYNSDGSRAEMCGNGIRCVGKYVYDHKMTDQTDVTVETLAGIKHLHLHVKDGLVEKVSVNMGAPILTPEEIPVKSDLNPVVREKISVGGKEYEMTCMSMGNPHAVIFMEDVGGLEIEKIGPLFEHHEVFPKRTNTEFVRVIDRKNVEMRVWERGAGETLACGTGACAVTVACILNGLTEEEITVKLLGGSLTIRWDRQENIVTMTGEAATVFEGEIENV